MTSPVKVYSYAGKATFRLNDHHQFEVLDLRRSDLRRFQIPTGTLVCRPLHTQRSTNCNMAPATWWLATTPPSVRPGCSTLPWTWGHNNLTDTPFAPNCLQLLDLHAAESLRRRQFVQSALHQLRRNPLRGTYTRQGLGYYENTKGDNYGLNFDTQKTFNFLGQHSLSFGYRYDRSHYDGTKLGRASDHSRSTTSYRIGVSSRDPHCTRCRRELASERHQRRIQCASPQPSGSLLRRIPKWSSRALT